MHCKERKECINDEICRRCWAATWERKWTGINTKGELKRRFGDWLSCRKANTTPEVYDVL